MVGSICLLVYIFLIQIVKNRDYIIKLIAILNPVSKIVCTFLHIEINYENVLYARKGIKLKKIKIKKGIKLFN